jgi:hypothetical protein
VRAIRFVNRARGAVRGVMIASAGLCGLLGVVFFVVALTDDELVGGARVAVLTLLFVVGVVVPLWLLRIRAVTLIDTDRIRVQLVGVHGVRIDPAMVEKVELDRIDPMADYRGFGLKGTRDDWMFGMSGTHAVRMSHRHRDRTRRLTVLCDTDDEARRMAEAMVAVSPNVGSVIDERRSS